MWLLLAITAALFASMHGLLFWHDRRDPTPAPPASESVLAGGRRVWVVAFAVTYAAAPVLGLALLVAGVERAWVWALIGLFGSQVAVFAAGLFLFALGRARDKLDRRRGT